MVCISGSSHQEDKLGSSRAAWIGAPVAEQQRPKKERFGVFDQNSRFQKMVLRTKEREQENGS